ncbi:MAG: magnesium transporter, partial [Planctomycetota bacterium]
MSSERWELSALDRLIREGSDEDLQRFFLLLRPPELADLLEHVPEEDRVRILRLMNAPLASEVLRDVEEPEREEILEDLSASEIAEIVHESKSDDAADILASLPDEKVEDTLERLDPEERKELKELLEFGEETAGGIMQTELVSVPSDSSVGQALEAVRAADPDDVGDVLQVYAVDTEGRLVGTVGPIDLLHADADAPLRTVLEPDPVRVPVDMDQERIAEIAREHDLAAVPVVDERNVLCGQVLHDDLADVIEEEATEDIAKMAGADPDELYEDSVGFAVRSRASWLVPAFLGGLLVAILLGNAENVLRENLMIAMFLPVILAMAGNVGTQTSALTVRGLALGRIEPTRILAVVTRQVVTGLSLGLIFGVVLLLFVLIWEHDHARVQPYAVTLALS